jgi:TadE-like protein
MDRVKTLVKDRLGRIHRGQGMVEFMIIVPVLLVMLSGLMEFGFLLNEYLDLLDGAREAARFASDNNPFTDTYTENTPFYVNAAMLAEQTLSPVSLCEDVDGSGSCPDSPSDIIHGDVVISVFGVARIGGSTTIQRFPLPAGEGSRYGKETSGFTTADINAMLDPNSPNTGIVVVEVFYDYPQKFKLPWITPFVPDPIKVRSTTIMPLVAAEPTPTPLP